MDTATAQALVRFGLGRRPSEPLPGDPRSWLLAQLRAPDPRPLQPRAVPSGEPPIAERAAAGTVKRRVAAEVRDAMMAGRGSLPVALTAALDWASTTPAPFRERLVWFWANHFTVSTRKAQCAVHIPAFLNETIRPRITGRFEEMLLAVMHSAAMLIYLDNHQSVGPHSRAGLHSGRGLNENLGRECMELHTVTPTAGYTQADVISMANLLTGWSVEVWAAGGPRFAFSAANHEPGAKMLMGQRFPEGEQGGVEALAFLANHPATHRHLATKLVRHFVADDPPAAAVRQIEGVLRDTRGDLGAASEALVGLNAAWQPATKLRTPIEWAIAASRALEQPLPPHGPRLLKQLGQPVWGAPQPDGWPDETAAWVGSEAMLRRIPFAYGLAGEKEFAAPDELAEAVLGPLLRPGSLQAIRRAGSRREAVAMLLCSPEFQRR